MNFKLRSNPEPLANLEQWSRKPEVEERHAVQSESRDDLGFLVRKVSFLDRPFEEADVVEDTREAYLCTCEDFQYNRWDRDEELEPGESVAECKHVRDVNRTSKAENDESQVTLENPVGK